MYIHTYVYQMRGSHCKCICVPLLVFKECGADDNGDWCTEVPPGSGILDSKVGT